MSWQEYVDNNLVGSGKVAQAAIIGRQGGVWATSSGFTIEPAEQQKLLTLHSKPDETQATGITVATVKYFTIQANDRSVYGKKGPDGIVVVRTTQAILVAVYKAPVQAPEATPVVEGLADYLIGVGY